MLCFGLVFLGFVITVKRACYAEFFVSRNFKIAKKYWLSLPFPPQFYSSRTLHIVKIFIFPSASIIFFVDFSLMFLITCVIYTSIVTLFDCLISSFYWLQNIFACEEFI